LPCGQKRDLFFAACVSEVDPALFHTIQDRTDQVRKAEGCRHVRIQLVGEVPEVVEMMTGEDDRLQLVRRSHSSFLRQGHEVHSNSSDLGVTGETKSLP